MSDLPNTCSNVSFLFLKFIVYPPNGFLVFLFTTFRLTIFRFFILFFLISLDCHPYTKLSQLPYFESWGKQNMEQIELLS